MPVSKPSPTTDWESIALTPRAKAHLEECFLPKYKKMLAEVEQTELAVLIWGPGKNGGDLYQKRLQIRGELRARGVTAMFSEDFTGEKVDTRLSLSTQELAQAKAADLVVAIEASAGSTAEVHDFGEFNRSVAHKLMVFIDEQASDGYSYHALLKHMNKRLNNVHKYKYPDDIESCRLLTAVLEGVTEAREAKWFDSHE